MIEVSNIKLSVYLDTFQMTINGWNLRIIFIIIIK